MDLGVVKLHSRGVNFLQSAIHPEHGLAWTDGQGIFLTPISLYQGQVENQDHCKLGEFDRGVKSIHWSDNISDGVCYMCVVHERNISIWRVEGHQPRLSFRQVRKINIQPVPQGIIWNPSRDILCALCPQQSSLYYSHLQNKGSQVLIQLDKDKIRCGCWAADGSKLVICVGTTLMLYHWSNIDASVTQYTALRWTVPGLTGCVSSVAALYSNQILLAAELPLEHLCKNQDTFLVPDLPDLNSNGPITDGITDGDIIRPTGEQRSLTESLLNLQRNPDTWVEDSCRLVIVRLREEKSPVLVASVGVKGVLSPDLLLFQASLNHIVIGSNSQALLQVFCLQKDQICKSLEISLDNGDRPLGVASLPKTCSSGDVAGILVLIGKKDTKDSAFLSSTSVVNMKSVLKFFNLKHGRLEKNPLAHTRSAPSIPITVATNGHQDTKDYDSIYESVLNFGTNLKNSSPDITKTENKENNNSLKQAETEEKPSESLVESVLREIPKANGFHDDSFHGNSEVKATEVSSPPKRPVRKKKSLRQNKESIYRHSTGELVSEGPGEVKVKMPMEYLSDSSEPSPRGVPPKESVVGSSESSPDMHLRQGVDINKNSIETKDTDSALTGKSAFGDKPGKSFEVETGLSNSEVKTSVSESEQAGNGSVVDKSDKITAEDTELTQEYHVTLITDNQMTGRAGMVEEIRGCELPKRELEVEKVDFKSQKANFRTYDFQRLCSEESENQTVAENYLSEQLKAKEYNSNVVCELSDTMSMNEKADVNRLTEVSETSKTYSSEQPSDSAGRTRKLSTSLESLEDIDKILKEQNEKIARLQEQMNKLSRRVDESSCVLPTRYQSAAKPDTVQVCFRCKDGFKIEKKFLLDNGRLQLQQVKQAFSLETVEIFIENEACVAGSNIDGYIPVRFEPGSTVFISGKPAFT